MLAVYDSIDAATNTISQIIGAGIIPAALEMMDQGIISAIEQAYHFGFPLDAQAVLLIEVDGLEAGLDAQRDKVAELCRQCGARNVQFAADAARAAIAVEEPQASVRRDRPTEPQLLHARRRRATH